MQTTTESPSDIAAFFEENGYYLARGVFAPNELSELENDFDRIVDQLQRGKEQVDARWTGAAMERLGALGTSVIHTHNVQTFSATWLRALMHEKFLGGAKAILGPDVILHHSKLFMKPPGKGAPFPMHQDWEYFPTVNDTMIAAVVHVSDATDDMGCFRVYPGSHKLGRRKGMQGQGSGENQELVEKYPLENATVLEAQPGDVLYFHYFTLHGSKPNISPKTRKTVLVQMHAGDDEIEEGNTHPNARLALSGWNNRIGRKAAGEA
ncbi:MAG TPA: phytanoyl-CoA dioxygenase family protein [Chthoniobacterales bacterium]